MIKDTDLRCRYSISIVLYHPVVLYLDLADTTMGDQGYRPEMLEDLLPQVYEYSTSMLLEQPWHRWVCQLDLNLLFHLNFLVQYYKRLFPYPQYAKWLQYGNIDKTYMARRYTSTLEYTAAVEKCTDMFLNCTLLNFQWIIFKYKIGYPINSVKYKIGYPFNSVENS